MIQIEACLVTAIDCHNSVFIVVVGKAFYTRVCARRQQLQSELRFAEQRRWPSKRRPGADCSAGSSKHGCGGLHLSCVHKGCVELASVKNV